MKYQVFLSNTSNLLSHTVSDHRVKIKQWREKKIFGPCKRTKKCCGTWGLTVIPIVTGTLGTITKGFVKGIGGIKNQRKIQNHPNYSIFEIGQNTGKHPGDLRRLAVIQILAKYHPLTLVEKCAIIILIIIIIIIIITKKAVVHEGKGDISCT